MNDAGIAFATLIGGGVVFLLLAPLFPVGWR